MHTQAIPYSPTPILFNYGFWITCSNHIDRMGLANGDAAHNDLWPFAFEIRIQFIWITIFIRRVSKIFISWMAFERKHSPTGREKPSELHATQWFLHCHRVWFSFWYIWLGLLCGNIFVNMSFQLIVMFLSTIGFDWLLFVFFCVCCKSFHWCVVDAYYMF